MHHSRTLAFIGTLKRQWILSSAAQLRCSIYLKIISDRKTMTVKVQRYLPFLMVKISTYYIFYQEKKSYCEKRAHTDIFQLQQSLR